MAPCLGQPWEWDVKDEMHHKGNSNKPQVPCCTPALPGSALLFPYVSITVALDVNGGPDYRSVLIMQNIGQPQSLQAVIIPSP